MGKKKAAAIARLLIVLMLITLTPINAIVAFASEQTLLLAIENPAEAGTLSQVVEVKGWAAGKTGVEKVEVYVDGKLNGQATYGSQRPDISTAYPDYLDSLNSGYCYSLDTKKLINGEHLLRVLVTGKDGTTLEKQINISSNNQQTAILGQAIASKSQMMKYFLDVNTVKSFDYINNFVTITVQEAQIEGVRADIVFAQMMKETNFLRFGGDVKEEQNNFAGLGATGGGNPGLSFPDIRTGIRAVVQHLKGYATTAPLVQTCVDPRYQYVRLGSSPIAEWLGKNENPTGYGWATDPNYGYDIVKRVNLIASLKVSYLAADAISLGVNDNLYLGKSNVITSSAAGDNKVLYQFWLKDYSTNRWELLKDYSEASTYTWTPAKAGNFRVELHVKDIFSTKEFDDLLFKDISVKLPPPAQLSSISVPENLEVQGSYTVEGTGVSINKPMYQFWLKDYTTGGWSLLRDYSDSSSYVWTPKKAGNYRVEIHIRDQYSTRDFEGFIYKDVTVNTLPPADLTAITVESRMKAGTIYPISATGSSRNKILYQYWVKDYSANKWILLKDFTDASTFSWTPSKSGQYRVEVHAKDIYSSREYDDYIFQDIVVTDPAYATSASMEFSSDFLVGKETTLTGGGVSDSKILYQYWVRDYATGKWALLQDYSEKNVYKWKPLKSGNYRLELHIKNYNSSKEFDALVYRDVVVNGLTPLSVTSFAVESKNEVGQPVNMTGTASRVEDALYQFWLRDYSTGKWTLLKDYSSSNSFDWIPAKAGSYRVELHVKGLYSDKEFDGVAFRDITIHQVAPADITSFTTGSNFEVGVLQEMTGAATSSGKVLYQFWLRDYSTGNWTLLKDYSENSSYGWRPLKSGNYRLEIHVKSLGSTLEFDDFAFADITVAPPAPAVINSFTIESELELERGKTYLVQSSATANSDVLYQFWAKDYRKGTWSLLRDYSKESSYGWTPMAAGNYRIEMHVKSLYSSKEFDNIIYKDVTVTGTDLQGLTIMLDAGHGGSDPGAVNKALNIYEKNLNMSLTQKVAERLTMLSANVIYTRQPNDDVYIDLPERVVMVDSALPDLLLSIHHDSSTDSKASGVSTHYSSYRPEIEVDGAYFINGGRRYAVLYEDPVTKNVYYDDNGVTKVTSLYDITVYDSTPSSAAQISGDLANMMQKALLGLGGLSDRKVQDHNLYMTRRPKVPSVLIEAGFVSNPTEVILVSDPAFEARMADAIVESILAYFGSVK